MQVGSPAARNAHVRRDGMAMAAVWFQGAGAISSNDTKLLIILGMIALALLTQAIVIMMVAVKSLATVKSLTATVEELKERALPLMARATELTAKATDLAVSTQAMVLDASPKVKAITDNLLDASDIVRGTAHKIDITVTDVNLRTQRQVARVDGMVTTTLTATAELAQNITEGIRVPVMKIAEMAAQAKTVIDGLLGRAKTMGAGFMAGKRRAG
jgi:hypothetical protein